MGSIVAVASGKGGTGKTTVCCGTAGALSLLGRKVCVVDMDAGLGNAHLALGLQDETVFDWEDVLEGRTTLENALVYHRSLPGLALLHAPAEFSSVAKPERFTAMTRNLASRFDYCFLDVPAGVGFGFALAVRAATRALIVATPDTPSIMDGATAAQRMYAQGVTEIGLVLNRLVKSLIRKNAAYNIDAAIDTVGIPLAGIVPEDRGITAAFNRCRPLALESPKHCAAVTDIALRLEGYPVRLKI